MKYALGYTAGALLHREAAGYIAAIHSFEDYFNKKEQIPLQCIPTNAESSKKRIKAELDKRIHSLNSSYLEFFISSDIQTQKLLLLLAICKCYSIIPEFILEVVYPKWKRFDDEVTTYDFSYFLSEKLQVEGLNKISESTKYKLAQVAIKILKDVGMIGAEKIIPLSPSTDLIRLLSKNKDVWFLNCLLIKKN